MATGVFHTACPPAGGGAWFGSDDRVEDGLMTPMDASGGEGSTWSRLMALAQRGDGASYVRLLRDITPLLRRVARRRWPAAGADAIEDVVQDVLLSLHAVRHTYTPGRPFEPWLMSILRHRLADSVRKSVRHSAREIAVDNLEDIAPAVPVAEHEDWRPDHHALHRAISDLPPAQRQAIELLKMKEMSLKEAAVETGMSIAALKVATHRAVKSLRAVFGKDRGR